jgi:hypothetical protein
LNSACDIASSGLATGMTMAFGQCCTRLGAMLCMIAKLSLTRSSRLIPGFRGLPDVMTTMSEPAAAAQSLPPMTRESEPMIGHVS